MLRYLANYRNVNVESNFCFKRSLGGLNYIDFHDFNQRKRKWNNHVLYSSLSPHMIYHTVFLHQATLKQSLIKVTTNGICGLVDDYTREIREIFRPGIILKFGRYHRENSYDTVIDEISVNSCVQLRQCKSSLRISSHQLNYAKRFACFKCLEY